jgi:hypothetical protein
VAQMTSDEIIKQALRLTSSERSSKAVAASMLCSLSLVNAWRSGQRKPSPEQTKKLARYLFPRDSARQRWLENSLAEARDPQRASLLKELDENNGELRIGSTSQANYGRTGFLEEFIARFLRLAGIKYKFVGRDDIVDLKEQLVQDELDVGVGIFATLDRSLLIKFFSTPIRVGLNAIVLEEGLDRTGLNVRDLRKLIAPEETRDKLQANLTIAPIVVRSDVGGIYASKILGYSETNLEIPMGHHYSSYGQKLIDMEDDYKNRHVTKIPVVLADDVMALYIVRFLDKQERCARIIFPFGTEQSAGQERKWLPEYLVSVAVKRTNTELADYLRDALRLFLRTEMQMISSFYRDVCVQFETMATEAGIGRRAWAQDDLSRLAKTNEKEENRAAARAWVEYTFGLCKMHLGLREDSELPWSAILQISESLYRAAQKSMDEKGADGQAKKPRRKKKREAHAGVR